MASPRRPRRASAWLPLCLLVAVLLAPLPGGGTPAHARALPLEALPGSPPWGRMARQVLLADRPGAPTVRALRSAVAEHRLLLLRGASFEASSPRGQADAHVALASSLAGDGLVKGQMSPHPNSVHPLLFRVSNDPASGITGVGTDGWHVDGTHKLVPQLLHSFHCTAAAEGADTFFLPLDELFLAQPPDVQDRWSSLWVRTGRGIVHPFVHRHPTTGRPSLCLFMGSHSVSFDGGGGAADSASVFAEVGVAIHAAQHLVYCHRWERGDLLIHDNLATAHLASAGTQAPPSQVGLRVLDRAAVAGAGPLRAWAPGRLPRRADGGQDGSSFVDVQERRGFLRRLWHSQVRHGMTEEQLEGLRAECADAGLYVE